MDGQFQRVTAHLQHRSDSLAGPARITCMHSSWGGVTKTFMLPCAHSGTAHSSWGGVEWGRVGLTITFMFTSTHTHSGITHHIVTHRHIHTHRDTTHTVDTRFSHRTFAQTQTSLSGATKIY